MSVLVPTLEGKVWISVAATALGALIAIVGAALNEDRRSRRERTHLRFDATSSAYVSFTLALQKGHDSLRSATRVTDPESRAQAVDHALAESGVYGEREKLLIVAAPRVVLAAEHAFQSVVAIRDALRSGAALDWPDYRLSWDSFAESIWNLRQVTRNELGGEPLDLGSIKKLRPADPTQRTSVSP